MTYHHYTIDKHPENDEMYFTRITYSGKVLDYFSDVTTHTASMESIKLH